MNINNLDSELFNELGSTKERLKYISGCLQESITDGAVTKQLVSHSQLDSLIANTANLIFDIIEEWKDECVIYPSLLKRIVLDRIEKDLP